VFGFLGLTSAPGQPPIFLADYSKSVNEVYDQTLRYLYLCSRGSDGRLLNPSLFRNFAVLLQHSLKLSHLEDLPEGKITRILAEIGEEHPTLTSMANLTSTYRNQGRWKEVEELEVQVMETRRLRPPSPTPSQTHSWASPRAKFNYSASTKPSFSPKPATPHRGPPAMPPAKDVSC
jgi:hypothetical protein